MSLPNPNDGQLLIKPLYVVAQYTMTSIRFLIATLHNPKLAACQRLSYNRHSCNGIRLPPMRALLMITLCSYFFILPAQAGQLDNLENEATKSSSKSKSSSSKNSSKNSSYNTSSSNSSFSDELEDEIAAGIAGFIVEATVKIVGYSAMAVVAGGVVSNERYIRSQPEPTDNNELHPENKERDKDKEIDTEGFYRTKGDPILPMLRISSHWLHSDNDINAQLHRIEAGYSFFGISYSQNILNEDGDQLKLSNTLIHYRMSFANDFSWDLAYGRGKMNGNQDHDGSVFAMPMRYRFHPDWHFEYYPVWSSYKGGSLAEHQFSFNYHYKYIGATLGYKTWSAGDTSIDGLFTGINLSF